MFKNECCPCSLLGNVVTPCNAAGKGVETSSEAEAEAEEGAGAEAGSEAVAGAGAGAKAGGRILPQEWEYLCHVTQ